MEHDYVLLERQDTIAIVSLNRPKSYNAFNEKLLTELHMVFDQLLGDDDLTAVILTGKGPAFAAGADLRLALGFDPRQANRGTRYGQMLMDKIEAFPCPVIAAINGPAMGGGAELAWACDLRIASTNAIFAQPEVRFGFNLGWGGTQRLPYLVGRGRAMEMMLLGETISAEQALQWGLVNQVVEPDKLMESALKMARKISRHSRTAVSYTKKATVDGYHSGGNSMLLEAELWSACFNSDEPAQRIKAFFDKMSQQK
jgi:enoyl-CoA hydratase/carnithine racemase